MKGDAKVISYLNAILKNELTAINQYFLHARMFEDWGFAALGKHEYEESIDEMKHADMLIKRILFLNGLPNIQELGRVRIGESVHEALKSDLQMEYNALGVCRETVSYCESVGDYTSRDLAASILSSEEEHIDWLETQLQLIDQIGVQNFLQSQV